VTYREKPFKLEVTLFKATPAKINTALYIAGSIALKIVKLQLYNIFLLKGLYELSTEK